MHRVHSVLLMFVIAASVVALPGCNRDCPSCSSIGSGAESFELRLCVSEAPVFPDEAACGEVTVEFVEAVR